MTNKDKIDEIREHFNDSIFDDTNSKRYVMWLFAELDRLNDLIAEERREGSRICLEWSETVDRLEKENQKLQERLKGIGVEEYYRLQYQLKEALRELEQAQQDKQKLIEGLLNINRNKAGFTSYEIAQTQAGNILMSLGVNL